MSIPKHLAIICFTSSIYSASYDSKIPNTDKETDFSALITFSFPIPYKFRNDSHTVNMWVAVIEKIIDLSFLTVSLIEVVVES